ncbi:MAG: hypothetical protein JNK89_05990 [Saprospiraceae bacterium]|nr:hypothetical protein [Saprospiraceae bacterium]
MRARHRDYLSCLSDIKQGYALLEQNQREHPDFKINLKGLGLIRALAANIPGEYRWAIQLLSGIEGNSSRGARELQEALRYARQQGWVLEREIQIASAFVQLHIQNDKLAAWETLRSGSLDPAASPLAAYVISSLAIRTARTDEAIRILENCPRGPAYHPFPYLDYLLGLARLHRLDTDADRPLLRFVQNFKGKNGLKEVYQKLAWHRLIHGDAAGYHSYMQLVKSRGAARSEPDQAAQREAARGVMPDPQLTRARLLFDGGYYQRAYALMCELEPSCRHAPRLALEYRYRRARIADELGHIDEAASLYAKTIAEGAAEPWYYACSAALYLGVLQEKLGKTAQAKAAYRQCLQINPETYAAGLHARAKAGLNRLREY